MVLLPSVASFSIFLLCIGGPISFSTCASDLSSATGTIPGKEIWVKQRKHGEKTDVIKALHVFLYQ